MLQYFRLLMSGFIIMQLWVANVISASEKFLLSSELAIGKSILEISKIIGRYYQTLKKMLLLLKLYKSLDKGHSRIAFQHLFHELNMKL